MNYRVANYESMNGNLALAGQAVTACREGAPRLSLTRRAGGVAGPNSSADRGPARSRGAAEEACGSRGKEPTFRSCGWLMRRSKE